MSTAVAATVRKDPAPDRTLDFLRQGYEFAPNLLRKFGTDAVETRFTLTPVVVTGGRDAAEMFYHPDRFTRVGALPVTVLALLQGPKSVATLSGEAHRHRKRLFLRVLDDAGVRRLVGEFRGEWPAAVARWRQRDHIVVQDEAVRLLGRAVCRWAGLPLTEGEADRRADDLAALVDGAGSVGWRMAKGLLARVRLERWAARRIDAIRRGRLPVPDDSPARVVAAHRDLNGELLPVGVAAKELINLLRPTVAIAWFQTFAALALHQHPDTPEFVRQGPDHAVAFAQEVRRFYPFFPFVAGRVLEPFEWAGRPFRAGEWVILDLYGTSRDPRLWNAADEFHPERFLGWADDPFALVAQGGGDMRLTHRCPGEPATVALVAEFARLLTTACQYDVPCQNLRYPLDRIPSRPGSGFVISVR